MTLNPKLIKLDPIWLEELHVGLWIWLRTQISENKTNQTNNIISMKDREFTNNSWIGVFKLSPKPPIQKPYTCKKLPKGRFISIHTWWSGGQGSEGKRSWQVQGNQTWKCHYLPWQNWGVGWRDPHPPPCDNHQHHNHHHHLNDERCLCQRHWAGSSYTSESLGAFAGDDDDDGVGVEPFVGVLLLAYQSWKLRNKMVFCFCCFILFCCGIKERKERNKGSVLLIVCVHIINKVRGGCGIKEDIP